ncbi:hypothetical protein N4P33_35270 [Streptomyces sp. 15-116A]|uniref:hypothetical protein n=1 Tax=Streptomyces sp. 15-116A TaxID=2259035 RepID=UPI0021B21CD6|nr:hypothetical protein [Streptomyces sp. 15-116A]MCT7357364.1 hypothetical protein [Streptomyces sp. 15-116A]
MSEETAPQHTGEPNRPKGLLQQMEELMATLNADLSALNADLRAAGATGGVGAGEERAGG